MASTLSSGLKHLSTYRVDVALLDLHLPDSMGLETFTRAREAYPDLALVVLSGHDAEELALYTVSEGA